MRVNDLYKDNKGIFYYMNEVEPLIFSSIMDISSLDLGFIALHGERELSVLASNIIGESVTPEKMDSLARVVLGLYKGNWDNAFNIMTAELPLETYQMITTENVDDVGETTTDGTRTNTDSDIQSVTGYNSPDYVDDEKLEKSSSETNTNTTSNSNARERTSTVSGNKDNLIDDRIKALNYLNSNLIYDIIFIDVSRLLGTLIY